MPLTSGAIGVKQTALAILAAAALVCAHAALAKDAGRDSGSARIHPPNGSAAATPNAPPATPASKNTSDTPAGAPADPATASGNPPVEELAEAQPEAWTEDEIEEAKAYCEKVLRGVEAVLESGDPIREGECGAPAPVRLISVGRNPEVTLSPAVTVTCDMVVTLARWIKDDVQPLAKEHLGAPIVRINTMSSYSCRNAYGRKKTRLSEHGRANAVDIGAFTTSSGIEAELEKGWGMTARDVRALVAKAKAEAEAAEKAASQARKVKTAETKTAAQASANKQAKPPELGKALAGASAKSPHIAAAAASAWSVQLETRSGGGSPETVAFAAASHLGGPGMDPQLHVEPEPDHRLSLFLRAIHGSACRRFGTVLGPEANDAHRNHFHLDMAKRKHTSICE